jgi:hypothetical protein
MRNHEVAAASDSGRWGNSGVDLRDPLDDRLVKYVHGFVAELHARNQESR